MLRSSITVAISIVLLFVLSAVSPVVEMNDGAPNYGADEGGFGGGEENDPSVTLTRPAGGEEYNVGEVFDILFSNSDLSGDIILELTTDGSAFSPIATKIVSASTSSWHEWTVPNSPTTTAQIRISSVDDPTINDISDYFTILGPCSNITRNVEQWDSTVAASPGYSIGTPVEYTLMSGNVWVSLIDNNANTPGVGDGWVRCTCEELANGEVWASSMGYGVGQVVAHNGMFWISTFSPNNGYEPGVDLDAWRPCIDEGADPCEDANGFAGPWYDQSVIYYSLGDVVEYPAGSGDYYVSNRDLNSAHPTDGTLRGWDLCSCSDLSDGTTWQSGNAYSAYQIVEHNGVLYVKNNAYVVAIGGDPEPGVAKGWTIFWRQCEPGDCAPIGVWNQADATAGYYDVGVVVKTIAWSATKWVSTVEDNALSPAFGNGWTWCKMSPWDPTIYYPGPVAPPSTTGGGYDDPTHARLKQGVTVYTESSGTDGREKTHCAPDSKGNNCCGDAMDTQELAENSWAKKCSGVFGIVTSDSGDVLDKQEIGKVCSDLTLGDDDTCFEQRVVTGGDTSTGGCWTDSDGLTWKDDCGEGDVAGVLSVSEHPPIVTGDCNDEMLAEVGVLISDGMYDSLDIGGHLLVEASGMATGPQCGAVVTIAASDLPLPLHEESGTEGRYYVRGYGTTDNWFRCVWEAMKRDVDCERGWSEAVTSGSNSGTTYSYVITDDSDDTADDGTDARAENCGDTCVGTDRWCYNDECVPIDSMYFALNFVGLTCDAIDIEGVMCDDAVIIEAHAEHDCGEEGHWGCPLCITTGIDEPPVKEDVVLSVGSVDMTTRDTVAVGGTFLVMSVLWLIGRRLLGGSA